MDWKRYRTNLLIQLGKLFKELHDDPAKLADEEKKRIVARFWHDTTTFRNAVRRLTHEQPGHEFLAEAQAFDRAWQAVLRPIEVGGLSEDLKPILLKHLPLVGDAIQAIPADADTESPILEAGSSFTAYCLIRDLCSSARERIVVVDPYVDQSFFYFYLRDLSPTVHVTIVGSKFSSEKRHTFIEVSRLFAEERGPDHYRLIRSNSIHDRWLLVDDQMKHLGGSVDGAAKAKPFTVSNMEATEEQLRQVESVIDSGTELFGPEHTEHPRAGVSKGRP